MRTLAVLLLATAVSAQTIKEKFDQKCVDMGITFFNKAEVGKITGCMEDSFYKTESMDNMKAAGVKCVMGACNIGKMAKGLGLLTKMNSCLKPAKIDTMKLVEKIFPDAKKALKKVYDEVMTVIKTAKDNKKDKAFVTNKGYTTLIAATTKNLINTVCNSLVKKLNKVEWECVKSVGKDVVNFNGYSCANIKKP